MAVTRTIVTIGDAPGVVLDAALLRAARLRVGDQVAVDVDERDRIVLTPLRPILGGRQTDGVGGAGHEPALLKKAS